MKITELPNSFLENMQNLLGEEYPAYLDSYEKERWHGLRINTSKLDPEQFQRMFPYPLRSVPWIANGFYYEEENRLSKDAYYYAGLYYLQEPSAMTPASLLPVVPGDMVLDLCAAPGGKSTELGARLQGQGMLVANDISNSRAKALLKNLELFGIPNICVTSETPEKLTSIFPEFFDKILIDAPCSGEGMFRKDESMVRSWLEKGPDHYQQIQAEIIRQAACMLKPGGYLLYSTCTFDRMEDERIIESFLEEQEEFELIALPLFDGASDGIGLSGCLRLFPHKIEGEGHFMALLRRKEPLNPPATFQQIWKEDAALAKAQDFHKFLELISIEFERKRFFLKQESVYYLPEGFPVNANLRYLRTGLLLGELKKGRFEPSQALAMILKPNTFKQHLSFAREDGRVLRYLKGETISLEEHEGPLAGWCLICVDGYPLGFAKGTGMTLKNKYYPGWRWQ